MATPRNTDRARRFYPSQPLDIRGLLNREDAVQRLESEFGDLFHPDFETVEGTGTVAPAGPGMAGFVAGWREWLSYWESWSIAADGFEEAGDRVLVLLAVVARSRTDRVEVPTRAANVLTFRGGRISRVELHTDVRTARRSAGLKA